MEDWDVEVAAGVITAAQDAAATPLARAMLDISSRDVEVPFSGSPKAMARLLDIAILTGNREATVNLSKKCQLRPLRRWGMDWSSEDYLWTALWKAARTALWASAGFQDLMVKSRLCGEDIPFPQALFLESKLEDWQEIRHLLPECLGLWRPKELDNRFGEFFLEDPYGPGDGLKLSRGKIRAAEDAGVDLQFSFVRVGDDDRDYHHLHPVTLLDMAIWCGQPDCAEACVDEGLELKHDDDDDLTLFWHKYVLSGESLSLPWPADLDVVPSEAQTAAAAAGRAWLKRSWKSESSQKGIALYQMMLKMFKGRSFPMALVQEILTFSLPIPKIIDQLDLWEHVSDWMASICGRPASVHAATGCNTANVEEPEGMQDNDEAGTLPFIEVVVLFSIVCAAKDQNSKWEP